VGTGTLKVTIDVTEVREPINGRVTAADEDPRQFIGWLELMSALQDILQARGEDAAEPSGPGRRLR
jgi:hypothetical protein